MENQAIIKFKLVTPCISSGADSKQAELRVPSIKGALRWWFRVLGWGNESEIFGGLNGGNPISSSVTFRLKHGAIRSSPAQRAHQITGGNERDVDYFLWPLRNADNARGVVSAGMEYELIIGGRRNGCGLVLPDEVIKAFFYLGSLGSRSRRCYGSIYPISIMIDGEEHPVPSTELGFKQELESFLDQNAHLKILKLAPSNRCREYKHAISQCSMFLKKFRCGSNASGQTPSQWGKNDHDAPFDDMVEDVYRQAIGLPMAQSYRTSGTTVESQVDGADRLASPVIFKVVPMDGGFMPLAIFFPKRTLPEYSSVTLKIGRGRSSVDKTVAYDLLNAMMDTDAPGHQNCFSGASVLINCYD